MPEEMHKKLDHDEYINTSTVKGKRRYQTDRLRDMINELEEAEDRFKDALIPFLRRMFKSFYDHKNTFTKVIQCVAELDCLCALASISSDNQYGPMTRPEILEDNGGEAFIELRSVRHPCVQE
jgi:DNA mismatch repair ATPase MutS